jgi:hypothetical protein
LTVEKRQRVIDVCKEFIEKLHMAAADDAHAAHSYAVFLEGALKKAIPEPPMPTTGASSSSTSSPET